MPDIKLFSDHSQRASNRQPATDTPTESGTTLSWALRKVAAFVRPPPATKPYGDIRHPAPIESSRPGRSDPTRRLHEGVDKLSFPEVREAMDAGGWFCTEPRGSKVKTLAHRLAASSFDQPHFPDIAQIVFTEADFNGQRVDLNLKNSKGDPPLHTALLHRNTRYFEQLAKAVADDPTIPLDLAATNRAGQTIWEAVPQTRPYAAMHEHLKEIRDIQSAARRRQGAV